MQARKELTAYIMWHIWKARNCWLFKNKWMPEKEIVQQDVGEWMEFQEAQTKEKENQTCPAWATRILARNSAW